MIFHVNPTDSRLVDEQDWELYDLFDTRLPGNSIKQSQLRESFAIRYVIRNFALGDSVPFEDWRDDQYGVLNREIPGKAGALARSWRVTRETYGANYFNTLAYKSGTSIYKSPDGVALFSTSHPVSRSQSGVLKANRPTTDADLGVATLQAARTNLVTQYAPSNVEIIENAPRALVVNPTLHQIAVQLTKGDWEVNTADRNLNTLKMDNYQVIEWAYFQTSGATGTNNAWFVEGDEHHLKLYDRQELDVSSDSDISTQSYIFVATARMELGHSSWRGVYGSLGF